MCFSSIKRFKSFDIWMHRSQLFCHNQWIYLNEYGSSCQIETSPLICSANQWTGFCIIGTSVMKDSRRSSSTYTESLFLHVVKHNLLFLFFFLSGFSFTNIHDSQDSRWIERPSPSILSTTPPPLYRHVDISWVIVAESSTLRIAAIRNRTWNLWHKLFRIYSFYTCAGSCCCLGKY